MASNLRKSEEICIYIKDFLLTLRSEFHLRRKESLKFSRRQETSTFQSKKHYMKTRRPIAHTRNRGVSIGGIQQSSRWSCARPTVFLSFIQRCFAPLSTRWIRTERRLRVTSGSGYFVIPVIHSFVFRFLHYLLYYIQ